MKGCIPAILVQIFVTVEGVSAIAHDLASLGDIAQLLGQFQ
jgi:hypothetical protein